MNGLKVAFKFYINASIHVALAVSSLMVIVCFQLDQKVSWYLLGFAFFGTITGYNFVKFAAVAGMHHRSLTNSLKTIQVFSFGSALVAVFCAFHLPVSVWYVSVIFGLLTFLYAVPFLGKKNLRALSGLKIFVVALVWAGITVFTPWAMEKGEITTDIWLLFFQLFLWVQVWTLPFEIRDLKYDLPSLKTLPQLLDVKKVKGLGLLFLVLIILMEGFKDELKIEFFYSLVVVAIVSGFFLLRSTKEQKPYYASFWVEAIPIMWLCILSLFTYYIG